MKKWLIALSAVGLALTVVPSVLGFAQKIAWQTHANLMIVGAVLWFSTAPFWMKKNHR